MDEILRFVFRRVKKNYFSYSLIKFAYVSLAKDGYIYFKLLILLIYTGRYFIWKDFWQKLLFINGNRSSSFCTKSCTLLNHTFKMEVSIHIKGFVKVDYQIVPIFSERIIGVTWSCGNRWRIVAETLYWSITKRAERSFLLTTD